MKETTNRFSLRLTDQETITLISELASSTHFKTKNEVINSALKYGLPFLYKEVFGKRIAQSGTLAASSSEENEAIIMKKLREISLTSDDIFIVLNIIEYLTTTIYNLEIAKLNKLNITDEQVRSGLLSELPDNLQRVKDEVVNRLKK